MNTPQKDTYKQFALKPCALECRRDTVNVLLFEPLLENVGCKLQGQTCQQYNVKQNHSQHHACNVTYEQNKTLAIWGSDGYEMKADL